MVYHFNEPKNTACIVCNHVLNKDRPILYVSHEEEDGFWQFLCGQSDHTDSDYKLISLEEVIDIDKSVNDIHNMPLGTFAVRKTGLDKWEI